MVKSIFVFQDFFDREIKSKHDRNLAGAINFLFDFYCRDKEACRKYDVVNDSIICHYDTNDLRHLSRGQMWAIDSFVKGLKSLVEECFSERYGTKEIDEQLLINSVAEGIMEINGYFADCKNYDECKAKYELWFNGDYDQADCLWEEFYFRNREFYSDRPLKPNFFVGRN